MNRNHRRCPTKPEFRRVFKKDALSLSSDKFILGNRLKKQQRQCRSPSPRGVRMNPHGDQDDVDDIVTDVGSMDIRSQSSSSQGAAQNGGGPPTAPSRAVKNTFQEMRLGTSVPVRKEEKEKKTYK